MNSFRWRVESGVGRIVVAALLLSTFGIPAYGAEPGLFEGAPPAPPGYADYLKARAAVLTGKVAIMTQPKTIPDSIQVTKDIVYASPGGVDLKLDVFSPTDLRDTPKPILLFIHGGGWTKGQKEDYLFYNVDFAQKGYVTASMQYRFSPEYRFPSAVQDVKCAIAWLKEHAPEIGGDPDRMALIGGSAGGHLALMGGYVSDPALHCPDLPNGVDTRVRVVVNFYGVVDCTTPAAQTASEVTRFIGKSYADAPEQYALASPLYHLTKDDPPTLTFHGTVDELVPVAQAVTLHKRLDELGIPNYFDRIEGWPHTMDLAKPINDRARYIMEKFFEKHLKN
jgi:acetyl esterase/lipase